MNLRIIHILFWILAGLLSAQAQLNGPEKIIIDSASHYPQKGFLVDGGYIIGGEEGSCNIATIWQMDENFDIIRKRQLIHDHYEISEVYDMKMKDSTIHVLTHQIEIEDAGSDDGIKWYKLDSSLEIIDSLYLPWLEPINGLIMDSAWIVNSWRDSLYRLSAEDGHILSEIKFRNGYNPLKKMGEKMVSWKEDKVFVVNTFLQVDTIPISENIVDLEPVYDKEDSTVPERIFVLTANHLLLVENEEDQYVIKDSADIPDEAEILLYAPHDEELAIITKTNAVHYFTAGTLQEVTKVQLYYNPVYEEDLHYQALKDGTMLRLGTTLVKIKSDKNIMYGKEFGFLHRFDKNYNDDIISRSNLSLQNLSISDTYYGIKPQYILGDTAYIITKDQDSKLSWKVLNTGADTVKSAVVSTNSLGGFNCANAYNSRFYPDIQLSPGDSIQNIFTVYKNPHVPHGLERRQFLYTGFPNNHYDFDFSDNLKIFTFRYIISSADQGPEPSFIKVYPNPAYDKVYITAVGGLQITQAEVIDIRGKITRKIQMDIPQSELKIDLRSAPQGLYLVRLKTLEGSVLKKITLIKR